MLLYTDCFTALSKHNRWLYLFGQFVCVHRNDIIKPLHLLEYVSCFDYVRNDKNNIAKIQDGKGSQIYDGYFYGDSYFNSIVTGNDKRNIRCYGGVFATGNKRNTILKVCKNRRLIGDDA